MEYDQLQSPLASPVYYEEEEIQQDIEQPIETPIHHVPSFKEQKPQRFCYDPAFLFLWILPWAAIIAISYFSYSNSNFYTYLRLTRIIYPFDSLGNQCGITSSVKDMPFLLFFNSTNQSGYKRCFPTCTNANINQVVCQYNVSASLNPVIRQQQIQNGSCIAPLHTRSVHFRCVPSDLQPGNTTLVQLQWIETVAGDVGQRSYLSRFYNQLIYAWNIIIGTVFSSFVFTVIWFSILLSAGHRVLHLSLFFVSLISWSITGYLTYSVVQIKYLKTSFQLASTGVAILDENIYNETYLLAATVVFALISLGILVAIFLFRNYISIGGRLVKETAKAIISIGVIPMFGSFQVAFVCLLTCYYVVLIVQVLITQFPVDFLQPLVIVFMTFWYLWSFSVIYLLGRTAVSAAVSEWYWKGGQIKSKGLFVKYFKKYFYHYVGTIAYGSIIVPVVMFLRAAEFVLRPSFFKAQVVEGAKQDTPIDKFKQWFSRILRIIHYRVFNEIGRNGNDFCTSASVADTIYTSSKATSLSVIGTVITWLGIILVTFGTSLMGMLLLNQLIPITIDSQAAGILTIGIFALIISFAFLGNFSVAVETIIYCHFEDLAKNDGSISKPYKMSDSLRNILCPETKK